MRLQKVNLTLKGGGLVLMQGQTLIWGLLELGQHGIGTVDQELQQVLPVDGLEMAAIWKDGKAIVKTNNID